MPASIASAERVRAWLHARPMVGDAALMVLLAPLTALATLAVAVESPSAPGRYAAWMVAYGLALASAFTLPLLWRRTRTDVATGVVAAGHLLQLVVSSFPTPGNLTVALMLYASARYGSARLSRWWLGLAAAGSLAAGLRWGWFHTRVAPDAPAASAQGRAANLVLLTLGCLGVSVAAWALGAFARQREETLRSLRDRAAALEREQDQALRLVVEEERTRLAREMHDVVAHSLSVIVIQSDGAGYLASHDELGDPAERLAHVARAVATINETARSALGETRRMVGALRADGEGAALAPAATLADVESLVARVREAGVDATLVVDGEPAAHGTLGSGRELAAYRVVQESLTNVLKHAGVGARVAVRLAHSAAGLDIAVRDDGIGATATDGRGHGVVGMRERVAVWGGTLTAGPLPDRGWQVAAHIPVPTKENR